MEIIFLVVVAFFLVKAGYLTSLKSWGKKSEAAASIQVILEEQQKVWLFDGDPVITANRYVQAAWDSKPDVFNGKFGVRPHKLSVILYSIALAVQKLDAEKHQDFASAMIAFGNMVAELNANGQYYPLKDVDKSLIKEAMIMVAPIMERESASPAYVEMEAFLNTGGLNLG